MIQASPTAPLGSVFTLSPYSPEDFSPTSAVLCRNKAPLIGFAFALIRRSIGCRVLGREIGASLISMIDKTRAATIEELEQKLESARLRELRKAEAADNSSAIEEINDRYACISLFVENESSIDAIKSRIASLFDDTARGLLTLATVHKSKGLEWPKVFILDRHLMPSKFAKQPWQQRQEKNLQYVAITRAKLDLVYINSNDWKKPTSTAQVADASKEIPLSP